MASSCVKKKTDIQNLYKLTRIFTSEVTLRKDKNGRLPQCFHCQAHGHVSSNCNMVSHCVKCSKTHEKGKCTIPSKDQEVWLEYTDPSTGEVIKKPAQPCVCFNCGGNHPASAKDCPKRLEILNRRKRLQDEAKAKAAAKSARISSLRTTYASAARGQIPPNPPGRPLNRALSQPTANNGDNFQKIVDFFENGFEDKINKAKSFGPTFQRIMSTAGVDAALSAWMLFSVSNVQFN